VREGAGPRIGGPELPPSVAATAPPDRIAAPFPRLASPLRRLARRPWHVSVSAFAAGLALARAGPALALLVAAALAGVLGWAGSPRLAAVAAGVLLAGVTAGDLRLSALDHPAERIRDGDGLAARAFLLTPPQPSPFGASAEIQLADGPLHGARLLARAAQWSPLPRSLSVGDELALAGTLRALGARAESAKARSRGPPFDYSAYLRRRGVVAELLLDRARPTGRRRGGLPGVLDRMRGRAERAVAAGMSADSAALLRGMVLGEDERVDDATRQDWRDAGLAHLLAVSGQNVMLLSALALPLLALAGAGLRARFAVVALLIAVYVPLAGAGPSLQRAGIMGLAGIVAMAASRPASRSYALVLAATATLAWNPRAWEDPGWQLSFAAVAGILALGVPLGAALRKGAKELGGGAIAGALADGIAVTVAATLATAPLVAHHFGSVPLAGLPANLLALPAVAPAMWLGMLKAALGQLAAVSAPAGSEQTGELGHPLHGAAGIAASALGVVANLPVAYLSTLGERFADMPGGKLALPLRSPTAVGAAYSALAAVVLLVRDRSAKAAIDLPWLASRWRALPRSRRAAASVAAVAVLAAAAAALLAPPGPPGQLTVRFLDVGQGDATLIQHPDGTAILFDGGPPEAGVTRLLRKAGVRRLALVVATHPSRDHHGGLAAVLRRFPVDALLDGGDGTPDPTFRALERLADRLGIPRVPALAPQTLTLGGGDVRIRVLSPPPRPPGPAPEDPNPRGVVAIVSSDGFDLMLSADAESVALLPLDLPDVDAMKVPHHGSSDPGLPEVLARLRPELAGIEVGLNNTYGHPAPETLKALRHAHVATYRTDRDGTITVTIEEDGMHVDTVR
jgi:competence protein ComEC